MHTISYHQAQMRPPLKGSLWERLPDVDWYQVAVVAVATFAIAMDLMFPPSRMVLGNGLTVYAGHFFSAVPAPAALQVDFAWLALELVTIVAIAVVGWNLGAAANQRPANDEPPAA